MPDRDDRYRIKFACTCGFDYQMAASTDERRTL
jgi:hypothetical protein